MEKVMKIHLDTPICELEKGATNKETYRDFIRNTEQEFDLIQKDIDNMSDDLLNEYINFLDYIWEK